MRIRTWIPLLAYPLLPIASSVTAQSPAAQSPSAASSIPPRRLPAPTVVSPQFVGSVAGLLELPNGMLLVNDARNHRVMMADALLRTTTVVIDSTEYGPRSASLMRYLGDSALFVEAITPCARVIDPSGRVVRTMAITNPRDAGWLMPSPTAMAGVDAMGRFVHRGVVPRPPRLPLKPGETRIRKYPDSMPIVRDDPVTRMGDTIAWAKSMALEGVEVARADGRSITYLRAFPVEVTDEWAVLSNGNVAILRGLDYHIDIIAADGRKTALPRMPYAWEPLSDSVKQVLIDSTRAENEALRNAPSGSAVSSGNTSTATNGGGGGIGGGASRGDFPPPPPGSLDVKLSELSDYWPAFSLGALKPGLDGTLWIRTNARHSDSTMSVYDIVGADGRLADRVLLPGDRVIVGFSRQGAVFLLGRGDAGVQWIERVPWTK